jgi:AcrR family transcriptional regulator
MFVKARNDRRIPIQERSQKRVERILDAAAQVFARQGYDAATMEAIASEADTSIGSIYQFFPNKLAVYTALARRYHDALRAFFDTLIDGPLLDRPWHELLDASIDAVAHFHENDPGFRAVWVGLHLTEQFLAEGEAINRELARRVEGILARKLPKLPPRMRPLAATMMVEVMTAMTILTARRPLEGAAVMAETKVLLQRYLAPYAPANGQGPRRPARLRSRR